jgi:hypothetical protein
MQCSEEEYLSDTKKQTMVLAGRVSNSGFADVGGYLNV